MSTYSMRYTVYPYHIFDKISADWGSYVNWGLGTSRSPLATPMEYIVCYVLLSTAHRIHVALMPGLGLGLGT